MLFALFMAAAAPPVTAALDPDTAPLLCGERGTGERPDAPPPPPAALPGLYRCSAEGLTVTLHIGADGRFEEQFTADRPKVAGAETDPDEQLPQSSTGKWRIEGGTLHLYERPQRAPAIVLVEAKRDPSVRMRIEVREPDGKPARGVVVAEGEDADTISGLDKGVVLVPLSYSWSPGQRWIVRTGDELRLTSFTVTRGGPNIFRFTYRPSEVEPFDEEAYVADARASAVIVQLGIGGALLQRVH